MPLPHGYIDFHEAKAPFFVGIDLGGTSIKVGVVDDLGRPLHRLSVPTEVHRGAEDAAARMGKAVRDAVEAAGLKTSAIARVGLGSPGTMDIRQGLIVAPVNLKGWDNFPLRDRTAFHCDLPLTFENDANAAAYGEYWVGSGRDFQSIALFTLGTGIGCGIIIDDFPIDGENSHGGECGHMIIDPSPDARICPCGFRGHLEAYASALSFVKRAKEALESGAVSSLSERIAAGETLSPLMAAEEAEKGDDLSLKLIFETARYLAVGIVNVMHTVDPSAILIGGAMTFGGNKTPLGRQFLSEIRQEVAQRTFAVLAKKTKIEFATLGGDAGFIGAAGMARLDYRKLTG